MARPAALVLCTVLVLAACGGPEPQPAARPNLIVLLTDDQRFDTLGCTGNTAVPTPSIDRLASEGALFPQAYVTTSLCCPARASLYTGQYPHRTGIRNNDDDAPFLSALPDFPELLQAAGYRTGFFGKWHITNPGAAPQPGFDKWMSFEGQGRWTDEVYNVDGERRRIPGFNTDVLFEHALAWLAELRADPEAGPWCLVLSLKNLHRPYVPAERHRGLLASEPFPPPATLDEAAADLPTALVRAREGKRNSWFNDGGTREAYVRGYHELVLSIDDNLARLLGALTDARELDSTALLYTSDGGFMWGEHGLYRKRTAYDPSIRVPLLLRYPPRVAAGARPSGLALTVDVAPTLLDLAGVPPDEGMQGQSLLPLVTRAGPPDAPGRTQYLYVDGWGKFIDGPMELAVVEERFKYVLYRRGVLEERLFDRASDPDERVDLLNDPAQAATAARLRAALPRLLDELEAPRSWLEALPDSDELDEDE